MMQSSMQAIETATPARDSLSAPGTPNAWSRPCFLDGQEAEGLKAAAAEPVWAPRLPSNILRIIFGGLVANESPANIFLNLLSCAGVCQEWRLVARELSPGVVLGFDAQGENTVSFPCGPHAQRFRKLTPAAKQDVFLAAARLFYGYTEVVLCGEGVTDRLLQEVGRQVGAGLTKIRISSAPAVTNAGLLPLVEKAPKLASFTVEDIAKTPNPGHFLIGLLDRRGLEHLHLSGVPSLSWASAAQFMTTRSAPALRKLVARGVNTDTDFERVLVYLRGLTELEVDGPARHINKAASHCPQLSRVSYAVSAKADLDEAITALMGVRALTQLELVVKNFQLSAEQLRLIGSLPLLDLRMDSVVYKQQPTLSRSSYSHVDNEGVKALVDSICTRWSAPHAEMKPMKLSLCGATALTHDAVSALLRLPILTELDIGGCCRITAMDKMRLVAKVRAGRELMESGRTPIRSARFPGLFF